MQTAYKNNNPIVKLSFDLAVDTIEFCNRLGDLRKWSLSDFIHKMKIAAKETDELEFYFEVCNASPSLPSAENLLTQTQSACKILNKIISTSKNNNKQPAN
ncbi:MAG TPA: four helix bundle protein [Flavipsychrobacter sp.]